MDKHRELHLGILLAKRHQYLDAFDRFKIVLDHYPRQLPDILTILFKQLALHFDNMPLRVLIAELYVMLGFTEEAIWELEDAFEVDPHFTQIYFLLRKIQKNGGCPRQIQALFEKAFFDYGINDSSVIDSLSALYLDSPNLSEGIVFLEALIEAYPQKISYHQTLSKLYIKHGEYEKAAQLLKTVVSLAPEHIGSVVKQCEVIVDQSPSSLLIRHLMVDLYIKNCSPNQTIPHLEAIISLDPSLLEEGIHTYKRILGLFPHTREVLLALSQVLIRDSQFSEAVEHLQLVAEKFEGDISVIVDLVRQVLGLYPDQILAIQLLAELYYRQEKYKDCLKLLHRLVELGGAEPEAIEKRLAQLINLGPPVSFAGRYLLACYFLKKGDFNRCQKQSQFLLNTEFDLFARILKAELFTLKGRYDNCYEAFSRLRTSHPYSWDLHDRLRKVSGASLKTFEDKLNGERGALNAAKMFELGLLLFRKGDRFPALEQFQKITTSSKLYAQSQFMIGRAFMEMGRYDLAQHQFLNFVRKYSDPHSSLATVSRYFMSISQLCSGSLAAALSTLDEILQIDVSFPGVEAMSFWTQQKAASEFGIHLFSGALDSLDGSLSFMAFYPTSAVGSVPPPIPDASFSFGQNNKGVEAIFRQNWNCAVEHFGSAVQLDSSLCIPQVHLGLFHLFQGDTDLAVEHLERADSLVQDWDFVSLNLGLGYLVSGDTSRAQTALQKAVALNPSNHLAMLNLGDVFYRQQRLESAFEYWEKASQDGTLFFLIQRRLGYLYPMSVPFEHWTTDFSVDVGGVVQPEASVGEVSEGIQGELF